MPDDTGFFANLRGLATAYVTQKRKTLQAEDPTTNVDAYSRAGGKGSYAFGGQDISHPKLREIKDMRESGGTVSQLMHYKALLHFGEGVEIEVGDDEQTEQPVDGYDEPLTLKEWLQDNFDSLDQLLLELGEDALWYPYAVGEIRETKTGGFADFLPAQPWTLLPETNGQGEIIAWHEETQQGRTTQTRTLPPEDIQHLIIHKNSARDTTGISEVLRNEDEIMSYKRNEQAIQNAIELHGFPQRHVKVGREEGAPVRDQELRRVRTLFDPNTTDANTAYFTGQDVNVESLEAEQFDYGSIHEMSMRQLTTALGLPLEAGNVGSDGLGSGKPAELRMNLLKLTITANQRMFCRQFVNGVMRPVVERYTPFDADTRIELRLGDPLEDIGDMASVIQQIGDHLTNDEIREKLDMAPHEDDEIGESYRPPAEIERPDDEQGGASGLFGSAPSDTDFRSLAEGYPISDRSECDGQVVEGPQGGLRCIPSGESGAEDDAVADGLDELAEEADSPEEFAKQTMETIEEGTGMKISGDVDTLDEEQTKALATGINSISKTDPDRLEEFSEFSQDVSRSLLDDSLRVDNNTMSSSHANYNSQHMFVNINSNGFDAKEEDAEFLVADAENMREEIAIHEFGHAFHDMALDEVGSDFSEIRDVELPEDRLEQEIRPYAAETPTEAVAEMFLYQSNGDELPDDVNEWYAELKGPEPLSGVDL